MKKSGNLLIPVYNEKDTIDELFHVLESILPTEKYDFTLTFVDDGSSDNSWELVSRLSSKKISFRKIKLSRNFGHQSAIFAGLQNSKESFVIIMDADFQDDPKYIIDLISKWEEGFNIVLARKIERKGEVLKKIFTKIYFNIQNKFTQFSIPKDVGHFSLLDAKIVTELNQLPEVNKFLLGLRAFIGSSTAYVDVIKQKRKYGKSQMSFSQLFNLSLDGILSFSTLPLNLIGLVGVFVSFLSIIFLLVNFISIIFSNTFYLNLDLGLSLMFLVSGIQLMSISILGQYISKIFYETKGRPAFIIDKIEE